MTAPACCCEGMLWLLLLPDPVREDRKPDAREDAEGWVADVPLPFVLAWPPWVYDPPLLPPASWDVDVVTVLDSAGELRPPAFDGEPDLSAPLDAAVFFKLFANPELLLRPELPCCSEVVPPELDPDDVWSDLSLLSLLSSFSFDGRSCVEDKGRQG